MDAAPDLTLAICTRNRPRLLEQLLGRIAPQAERSGVRLLVVDSASDLDVAADIAGRLAGRRFIDLIRLDRPGVSLARNAALEATLTSWLGFIDDDELPPRDWLEQALALCSRLPADCAACGGNTLPKWPDGARVPAIGWRWMQYLSVVERGGEFDQSDDPLFAIGHSVVRVSALRELGGFDRRLGRDGANLLSGEEVLLVDQLIARGWRIWHSDRLTIEHMIEPERLTRNWVVQRAYWEGVTRARVLRISDPAACRRLVRDVKRKAPLLRLLASVASERWELDLRAAFARGVLAESDRARSDEGAPRLASAAA